MRRIAFPIMILFIVLFMLQGAKGAFASVNWSATGGPFGHRPGTLVDVKTDQNDSNNIYVLWRNSTPATYILLRSSDGGATWNDLVESTNAWVVGDDDGSGTIIRNCTMFGIAVDPGNFNRVFAFGGMTSSPCKGGVWYSDNAGETWEQIYGQGIGDDGAWGIYGTLTDRMAIAPSDPSVIYRGVSSHYSFQAGIGPHEMSESTDGGSTWTDISTGSGIPPKFGVNAISVHPTDEAKLAVCFNPWDSSDKGTFEAGAYISTNEGASFELILSDPIGYSFSDPSSNSPQFASVDFDRSHPEKIRVIRDAGRWSGVYPVVYSSPEVYISTNEGCSWTSFEVEEMYHVEPGIASHNDGFAAANPNDFNTILFSQLYLWRSVDGGQNWSQIGDSLSGIDWVSGEAGTVFIGKPSMPLLRKSTNNGVTWTDLTSDLLTIQKSVRVFTPPLLKGCAFSTMAGLWRTTDYGGTWANISSVSVDPSKTAFDPNRANVAYTITGAALYRTDNNMSSWSQVYVYSSYPSLETFGSIAVSPTNSATLFATIDRGFDRSSFVKSSDYGASWSTVTLLGTREFTSAIAVNPITPEIIYLGIQNKGIRKSTDEGHSWVDITPPLTEMLTVSAIGINPKDPNVIYAGTGNGSAAGRIYMSTNGGASWSSAGIPPELLTYVKSLVVNPVRPERIYALFYPAGLSSANSVIARRIEGAAEYWTTISGGISGRDKKGLDIDRKTDVILYAATDNGVYKAIDYDGIPGPTIEAVSPHYTVNLSATNLMIDGNYFIDLPGNAVSVTGPGSRNLSFTADPARIYAVFPPRLLPGTYWISVTNAYGTSNSVSVEVIGASPDGPTIEAVSFDDSSYMGPMDPVSRSPRVKARIKDSDGINRKGFEYVLINKDTTDWRSSSIESMSFSPSGITTEGTLSFTVSPYIASGRYDFTIVARDTATTDAYPEGNVGAWTGRVAVEYGELQVIGDVLTYPHPFMPLSGTKATIAYNLSQDADITIYVYDISGQIVLTRKFGKGRIGGHAGYNSFEWNGISDLHKRTIGNGIYIIKVISGNKMLKAGKIVVND